MSGPYRSPGARPPVPPPKKYGEPDLAKCGIRGHAPYDEPITNVESVNAPPCKLWHCPHCLGHVAKP